MSGFIVGSILGLTGSWVLRGVPEIGRWLTLGVIGLILALREVGFIRFNIPQLRRQTKSSWYRKFGPIQAAWWWGVDLGSGLTALITFSGYWLLVLAILFRGDTLYGGAVLGLYGTGRAIAVGLPPLVLGLRTSEAYSSSLPSLLTFRPDLRKLHGYGLMIIALGLLLNGVPW